MSDITLIKTLENLRTNYLPKWKKQPAYEKITKELFLTECWHEIQISKNEIIEFWFDIIYCEKEGLEFVFGTKIEEAKSYSLEGLVNKIKNDYFNYIECDEISRVLILDLVFKISYQKELKLDNNIITLQLDMSDFQEVLNDR